MTKPTGHSPLGASGASRWMKCPGSVTLAGPKGDIEESEHAQLGTAAHALAARATEDFADPWFYTGMDFGGYIADADMVAAVGVYTDFINERFPRRDSTNSGVERAFHCPSIHPLFYGTTDFWYFDEENHTMHIVDYKHGAGVVVEVQWNVQEMYYAAGVMEDLLLWEDVDTVVIHVVQPRAWHGDGPIRSWRISTMDLVKWIDDDLIPAMELASSSTATVSGEHCRFCPVRYKACPQLQKDADEAEAMMAKMTEQGGADELTDAQVARFLDLQAIIKIAATAANKVAFTRMSNGVKIPGYKLVKAKANRTWREGAEEAVTLKFGEAAWTDPELKSPAAIDDLPEGKSVTDKWAFKPDTGLTVVKSGDSRAGVPVQDKASLFTPVAPAVPVANQPRKRTRKGA